MATPSRLARAPIHEAVVDLRIVRNPAIDAHMLEPVTRELRSRYPQVQARHSMHAQVTARGGRPEVQAEDRGFHGLFLENENRTRVLQLRVDGFTLSQLGEYTTADELFAEALPMWALYAHAVNVNTVARVALRYINKLALPYRPGEEFSRFLTAAPPMPPEAPQEVAEFLTRSVVPIETPSESVAIVTQRLELYAASPAPFTLDIDVFKSGEFSIAQEGLMLLLQELRRVKNQLFFAFLTDEALEPCR